MSNEQEKSSFFRKCGRTYVQLRFRRWTGLDWIHCRTDWHGIVANEKSLEKKLSPRNENPATTYALPHSQGNRSWMCRSSDPLNDKALIKYPNPSSPKLDAPFCRRLSYIVVAPLVQTRHVKLLSIEGKMAFIPKIFSLVFMMCSWCCTSTAAVSPAIWLAWARWKLAIHIYSRTMRFGLNPMSCWF